jgi:urease accessory protein
MTLPGSEQLISLSVLVVGILIAFRQTPNHGLVTGICAVAGVLHGYAYGESIFGAEATPLTTYLVGFTVVQLSVAGIAYAIARKIRENAGDQPLVLRPAGFVVAGVGLALLATQLVALSFPVSS